MAETPSTPVPVLTEKTKIRLPLSVVVSIAVPMLGAMAWATKVYTTIEATHATVVELKADMRDWRGGIEDRLRLLEGASRVQPTALRNVPDRTGP